MSIDHGRSPSEPVYSAEPEPKEVSAVPVSIPNAEAFHPSELIQDELDARGWDKFDLVARMGGDPERSLLALDVYFIVGPTHPNCRIGDTMAHQLAVAFDVSAQYFLNLEMAWLDHPSTKALASAIEARERPDPVEGLDQEGESAVGEAETPKPLSSTNPNTERQSL